MPPSCTLMETRRKELSAQAVSRLRRKYTVASPEATLPQPWARRTHLPRARVEGREVPTRRRRQRDRVEAEEGRFGECRDESEGKTRLLLSDDGEGADESLLCVSDHQLAVGRPAQRT